MTAIKQSALEGTIPRAIQQSFSREPKVLARIDISRSSLREMVSRGEFPAPIRLGARAVGWLDSEVDAWIESRIAASRKSIA